MLERGYRHFVVLLDSERYSMSPAVTMWKTHLRSSLKTILGQQQERHLPYCTEFSSHSWSDVAFDHRPTRRFYHVLRRACLMRRLQAYFPIGCNHRCFQFVGAYILFALDVHRRSGIHHEFSLLWLFRRGYRHYPCLGMGVKRGLVLCFELSDTCRQRPCFAVGASFLLQEVS